MKNRVSKSVYYIIFVCFVVFTEKFKNQTVINFDLFVGH